MPRSEPDRDVTAIIRPDHGIAIAIGGLPSPESSLTIHCAFEILRRARGSAQVLHLNTAQDREGLAGASGDEPTLLFFDTPDGPARDALLATGRPIVVVSGDFAETARFCMAARDLDMLQAARFVSQSFSCLEPLHEQDGVHWLVLDRMTELAEWIDQLAAWIGLRPGDWEEARQQMLAEYAAWPTVEAAMLALVQHAAAACDRLPGSSQTLFEALGQGYRSGPIGSIFWPAACILEPGNPALPVAGAMALTGPTRMLTFGPFLHLPPGRWRARYQFEVDEHPAGNLLEFDILNGSNILVSHRVLINDAGEFGFDCEFEMDESRLPVENRAILAEGSIGGHFKPTGIWLNRNE